MLPVLLLLAVLLALAPSVREAVELALCVLLPLSLVLGLSHRVAQERACASRSDTSNTDESVCRAG